MPPPPPPGRIDFSLAHGAAQHAGAVGVVLQQVHVHVEGEQKCLVLGLEHALQKLCTRLLFQRENVLLAARRIQ